MYNNNIIFAFLPENVSLALRSANVSLLFRRKPLPSGWPALQEDFVHLSQMPGKSKYYLSLSGHEAQLLPHLAQNLALQSYMQIQLLLLGVYINTQVYVASWIS